jgi:hypothetical protein
VARPNGVFRSLIVGDKPGMSSRDWIQASNPALESLIAVANIAVDLAQKSAERTSAEANAESEGLRTGFRRKPDSIPMIADS